MADMSILVGLSGSQGSEKAALAAWELAGRSGARVAALHVIDADMPMWFLSQHLDGIGERQAAADIFGSCCSHMQTVADALKEKYLSVFASRKLAGTCDIDYGDPASKLSDAARHHDLVVLGTSAIEKENTAAGWSLLRGTTSKGLARSCPVPLLIVDELEFAWRKLAILVSRDHTNPQYIRSCISLATILGLLPEIICVATDAEISDLQEIRSHLRSVVPELSSTPILMSIIKGACVEQAVELWSRAESPVNVSVGRDTLLVVPSRMSGRNRFTIFGETVDEFLNHQTLPTVLLWPEEYECEVTTSRIQRIASGAPIIGTSV